MRRYLGLSIVFAILLSLLNGCGGGKQQPPSIAVSVTPSSVSLDDGQSKVITATVSNDTASAGVTWALSGAGTLSGQTATSVTFSAPTSGGATTATITATSVSDGTKKASVTITMAAAPSIAASPLPSVATNGTAYSFAVPVSGGSSPLTWSISAGALPTGLSLSGGTISGTPNANATQSPYSFTVQVTDAVAMSATQAYSMTINNPAAPVIASTAPPAGTNGSAYSAFTFALASGGLAPFTWSENGTLPTGMTFSAAGVLSGTPQQTGAFPITVSVQDSSNPKQTASSGFTIQINNPAPPTITTTTLPDGAIGAAYSQSIHATGGLAPYTWSISGGALPAGLTLGSSTSNAVTVSGTPTTVQSNVQFTVQVTDAASQTGSKTYTMSVNAGIVVTLSPSSDQSLDGGQTLQITPTVSNDGANKGVSLVLNPATGCGSLSASSANSGTAVTYTAPASPSNVCQVTVTATSISDSSKTAQIKITVNLPLSLPAPSSSLPGGATVGASYSSEIAASGGIGTYTYTVNGTNANTNGGNINLGNGLTAWYDPAHGWLSLGGQATSATTTTFTLSVTDNASNTIGPYTYSVVASNPNPLTLPSPSTNPLPSGTVGAAYNGGLNAGGGLGPYTFSINGVNVPTNNTPVTLSNGLTAWNSGGNSLLIGGTPSSTGTVTLTNVKVTDSTNAVAGPYTYDITINNQQPLTLPPADDKTPGTAAVGVAFNAGINASGGVGPYTFTVNGTAVPTNNTLMALSDGLSVSSSGGNTLLITGTPTATSAGIPLAVSVTDSASHSYGPTPYTIVVSSPDVCPTGNEAALNGHYAFILSGYYVNGFQTVVGSFTADGAGHIANGEYDANGISQAGSGTLLGTSSYSVGADGRGCVTIVTSGSATYTTRVALGSFASGVATKGRMIEWDTPSQSALLADGQILKQDTTAFSGGVNGNWTFLTPGVDGAGNRLAHIGVVTASSGAFTNLAVDENEAGTLTSLTGGTGTYGNFDANGRSAATTSLGGNAGTMVMYMVNASDLLMIASDPYGQSPVTSGESRKQSGTFTNASLNAKSVFYMTGASDSYSSKVDLGFFTGDGAGSFTASIWELDGSACENGQGTCTLTTNSPSGTYSVASNGKVTGTVSGNFPIIYLIGANTGFWMNTGNSVGVGQMQPQTGGPFSNASLSGSYFMGDVEETAISQNGDNQTGLGVITLDGAGNVTGSNDGSSLGWQSSAADVPFTGQITVNSDGTFTPDTNTIAIVVSPSQAVMIDHSGSSAPVINIIQK